MPDSTNTLPEQIIQNSRAFTETLHMENTVFLGQLNGAITMTLHAFRDLIILCKDAIEIGNTANAEQSQQKVSDIAQQALADIEQAGGDANKMAQSAPVTPPVELDSSVVHAVSISYMNAVNAQQQTYITQQAAATEIITTILSVATATLSIAVKNAEAPAK